MRLSRTALRSLLVLGLAAAGGAADAEIDVARIDSRDLGPAGAPNAAYLDAARWRGLQTEVAYLRPGAPLPEGEVAVPDAPAVPDPQAVRRNWAVAAGLVLALVLAFAAWYGRGLPVSFGAGVRDRLRRGADALAADAPAGDPDPEALFARLAAMPDRRRALILLAARALERAAEANGLRLGRSQTARDVLGVLPRRWPHGEALRRLVAEAEIVHFGGRDLAEARWRDCLAAARPLFAAGRRA